MKPLSFWRGVGTAALLSVVGSVLASALGGLLGGALALRLGLLCAAGIYVLVLLAHGPVRNGRVLAGLTWLALSTLLVVFNPPLLLWLLLLTTAFWLLRSLRNYSSLIPAAADGLLSAFALAAAVVTANHTHSLLLSLWSYFVLQALTAFLPRSAAPSPAAANTECDFDTSYRNAEAALRRLSLRH